MAILAIDPGDRESAYVIYEPSTRTLVDFGKIENSKMIDKINHDPNFLGADAAAIEMIKSYGMPMGDHCLMTCLWVGRFIEAWHREDAYTLIPRKTAVAHICGKATAKDKNVRQALIDLFSDHPAVGEGSTPSVGTKKQPGPLYGVKADVWAALSVAITYVGMYHQEDDDESYLL